MKIIIVEDEFITALDLKETLIELGHEVLGTATNHSDAIYLAKTTDAELALLDISINGPKDGVSLAKDLQDEYQLGIVFVTAFVDSSTLSRVKALKPDGYLVKPFSKDSIKAAIELAGLPNVGAENEPSVDKVNTTKPDEQVLVPQNIKVAMDYINSHFNRDLPIQEVADLIHLNVDYFSSQFKKAVGTTPQQFITEKRIDEAKHLLRHTQLSIKEVSQMVGYPNHSYFAAKFKQRVGLSPSDYKRL